MQTKTITKEPERMLTDEEIEQLYQEWLKEQENIMEE